MPESFQLDAADREFWQLISRAAFANPFSPERRELDLRIAGTPETNLEKLSATVFERVAKIEKENAANFRSYTGVDARDHADRFPVRGLSPVLRTVGPTRFCNKPNWVRNVVRFHFAGEIWRFWPGADSRRTKRCGFFAIFYQMRRAYFFIVHGLIGRAPCMQELRRHLWNNVFTSDIRRYDRYLWNRMEDFSTLLLGRNGNRQRRGRRCHRAIRLYSVR